MCGKPMLSSPPTDRPHSYIAQIVAMRGDRPEMPSATGHGAAENAPLAGGWVSNSHQWAIERRHPRSSGERQAIERGGRRKLRWRSVRVFPFGGPPFGSTPLDSATRPCSKFLSRRDAACAGLVLPHYADLAMVACNVPFRQPAETEHAPPHLREVCAILAVGILRLRSRTGEETARRAEPAWGSGDIQLHSTARQRLHVLPNREG